MPVILLTISSTCAFQLGFFLWKLAADAMPQIDPDNFWQSVRNFLTHKLWVTGFFMTFIGWGLFIAAANLGDLSIVQPLMSVGDIFLVTLAVVFLKEKLSSLEWLGLGVTILGGAMLALQARAVIPPEIHWDRVVIFIASLAVPLVLLSISVFRKKPVELLMALLIGVSWGIGAMLTKLMTSYVHQTGHLFGFWSMVLNPVLPFMIAANTAGIIFMQIALQHGRAAVIIPLELAFTNSLAVVAGVFVFNEHISLFRIISIVLIMLGPILLHRGGGK